jgi:hypothetical protein
MNPGDFPEMGFPAVRLPRKVRISRTRNMVVSNKRPLAEDERRVLIEAFKRDQISEDPNYRTARVIWSTACHPWSLANAYDCRWRITEEAGHRYINYIRAKQAGETCLDLDPAIAEWILDFLRDEGGYTEREYHRRVKTYGSWIGLDGLGPRALRHDRIFLTGRAVNWDYNVLSMMFGTDMKTLLGYTATERAKTYSEKILREAFG